jgi:V8-like Glu-specific endopeptidase
VTSRLAVLCLLLLSAGEEPAASILDCEPHLPVLDTTGLVKVETSTGICTGAAIGPTSVLTAQHCLDGAARVIEGDGSSHTAVLAVVSQLHDIALLKLVTPVSTYYPVAPEFPEGMHLALSLQGYGCDRAHAQPYQRSAVLNWTKGPESWIAGCVCFGDSGGPALNENGELVGLMIRTYHEGSFRGQYAVIIRVRHFLESLPPGML